MMLKNIYSFLLVGLVVCAVTSCEPDDADVSTISNTPMTIETVDANSTQPEEGQVVTVNFSLSEDQFITTEVIVTVDPFGTTATLGEDYNFAPQTIEIPAYVRTGSFTYEILADLTPEETETITFSLDGVREPFGATNTLQHVVSITNKVSDELQLVFDWDGLVPLMGLADLGIPDGNYPICGNVDLDIYVLDADGNDLGIYPAATGACPEIMVIDQTWDDGTYFLASNMWENGYAGLMANAPFPITISAAKGGVFIEQFSDTTVWTSEDADQANGGNATLYPVCTVTKAGTNFTIELPNGTLIAQGLVAPSAAAGKVPMIHKLTKQ